MVHSMLTLATDNNFRTCLQRLLVPTLKLSIITSSFSSFGFLGGLIIVPMVPVLLAIGLGCLLYPPWKARWTLLQHDYIALLFVGVTLVSALVYPNSKSAIYVLVYFLSFTLFAFGLRLLAERLPLSQALQRLNTITVVAVGILCVIEFFLEAHLNFDIQEYLPRLNRGNAICTLGIPRSYAFAIEPTYLSWYFNTLGVVGLHHLWRHFPVTTTAKAVATSIIVFAYCTAFSIAAFGTLLIGASLLLLWATIVHWRNIKRETRVTITKLRIHLPLIVAIILLPTVIFVTEIFALVGLKGAAECFGRGLQKVTFDQHDKPTTVIVSASAVTPRTTTMPTTPKNMKAQPAALPLETPNLASPQTGTSQQAVESKSSTKAIEAKPDTMKNDPAAGTATTPELGAPQLEIASAALETAHPAVDINNSTKKIEANATAPAPIRRVKINRNRNEVWTSDFQAALLQPLLGMGPGYKSSKDEYSSINLFLFVMLEQGVVALMLLVTFFVSVYLWIARTPLDGRWVYLLAYGAGALHLATMTQHYYTNLWLLLMLFQMAKSDHVDSPRKASLTDNHGLATQPSYASDVVVTPKPSDKFGNSL